MRDARARGIKRYNFWGIVEENETKHRFMVFRNLNAVLG